MKILVIGLGGTIGSVKEQAIALDKNNLKILDYCKNGRAEFVGVSPFSVLSEDMSLELWHRLTDFLKQVDFSIYEGAIILHGSDTLAFTGALVYNAFPNEKIALVASDKPLEDKTANGIKNFNAAVEGILDGKILHPVISYNGIFKADSVCSIGAGECLVPVKSELAPVGSTNINDKNILIISPYVGIDFKNYSLENTDCVLFSMYHSATFPSSVAEFCSALDSRGIEYYFVTHRSSAEYVTAEGIKNMIFGCTIENAYAKILLTN